VDFMHTFGVGKQLALKFLQINIDVGFLS